MKLDDLRARLRTASKRSKPKRRPKKHAHGKCQKCGLAREPAKLTDPDVAQILEQSGETGIVHALRCRECRTIWIAKPIDDKSAKKGIRKVEGPGEPCSLCKRPIPHDEPSHFFTGFTMCRSCSIGITGES